MITSVRNTVAMMAQSLSRATTFRIDDETLSSQPIDVQAPLPNIDDKILIENINLNRRKVCVAPTAGERESWMARDVIGLWIFQRPQKLNWRFQQILIFSEN